MSEYLLTNEHIKAGLDHLAKADQALAEAINEVGYPQERRRRKGYQILMHIIGAQQLSTKAATTIMGRLHEACGPELTPETFLALSDEAIRGAGFSRQKLGYGRGLSEMVRAGDLDFEAMEEMDDDGVLTTLTAIKGFGRWSAEMYMISSLGRPDIWPADDLAVQEAVRRLKGLKARPGQKEMDVIGEAWRPHRAAVAIFLWHYYKHAPAI